MFKALLLLLATSTIITNCGSVGENLTDGGKCTLKGNECTEPAPSPIPGPPGPQGPAGKDGNSCSIEKLENGAVITCGGTSVVILNGEDGQDGEDAPPTSYTVTEIINPCGTNGAFDEVILRLANRQLIAHYSGGGKEFLTIIGPGSYTTTDSAPCSFTVDSNLDVHW